MILAVYFLLFFVCISNADYRVTCNNSTQSKITFEPAGDGVTGRYIVEWCTEVKENIIEWNLMLKYLKDNRTIKECNDYQTFRDYPREVLHSRIKEHIKLDLNCTNICLSKSLDLIFSGCYAIKKWLRVGSLSVQNSDTLHYVDNEQRSASYFNQSKINVRIKSYGDIVYAHWFTGYIPVTDYEITLCNLNRTGIHTDEECVQIRRDCSRAGRNEVECHLRLPPACYNMAITYTAPWTDGSVFQLDPENIAFCHPDEDGSLTVKEWRGPSTAQVWAACGAVLLLALVTLAALAAWRSAVAARLRMRVLRHWLHRYDDFSDDTGLKGDFGSNGGSILLLYARDCAPAMRAVKLLREMLEMVAPGQVYDIFSPQVAALSASAPSEWVRGAVEHAGTRVVLLQTPAAACLYAAELNDTDDTLTLREPLLPGRVSYRAPQFGDTLVQYALRLLRQTAFRQRAYHKYYVATLSDLPAETVPHVVPFRRYELPAATALLLRDVALPAPAVPPGAGGAAASAGPADVADARLQRWLEEFTRAVAELVEFVRNNENYLQDELLFL